MFTNNHNRLNPFTTFKDDNSPIFYKYVRLNGPPTHSTIGLNEKTIYKVVEARISNRETRLILQDVLTGHLSEEGYNSTYFTEVPTYWGFNSQFPIIGRSCERILKFKDKSFTSCNTSTVIEIENISNEIILVITLDAIYVLHYANSTNNYSYVQWNGYTNPSKDSITSLKRDTTYKVIQTEKDDLYVKVILQDVSTGHYLSTIISYNHSYFTGLPTYWGFSKGALPVIGHQYEFMKFVGSKKFNKWNFIEWKTPPVIGVEYLGKEHLLIITHDSVYAIHFADVIF